MSFFCDYSERAMSSVWVGRRFMPGESAPAKHDTYFGATHITEEKTHPVVGRDSDPCVTVGTGLWREKIYHFLPDKPPSSGGDEIQTEFFVKYSDLLSALDAIYSIRDSFRHLLQVTEIRMVKGDNLPLSPAKGNDDYVGIHFTWKRMYKEIL